MDDKNIKALMDMKRLINTLVLIKMSQAGVSYPDARDLLGSLDNNSYSKINMIFGKKKSNKK